MELRQLRYYKAVVEHLSFSGAARRLDVSQSAISRQIKSLEDDLGTQLLERSKSHVALTTVGEAFYRDVCWLLTEADIAVEHVRTVARNRGIRRRSRN